MQQVGSLTDGLNEVKETADTASAKADSGNESIEAHKADQSNPHNVTTTQIGAMPIGGTTSDAVKFGVVNASLYGPNDRTTNVKIVSPVDVMTQDAQGDKISTITADGTPVITQKVANENYQAKIDSDTELSVKTVTAKSGVKSSGFMTTTPDDKFAFAAVGANISQLEPDGSNILTKNRGDELYASATDLSTLSTRLDSLATSVDAANAQLEKIL